jgi:hypothetical protein
MNQTVQGGPPPGSKPQGDYRTQALAIGVELARNAVKARTLDELQFILVNDIRSLLPCDRAFLITHLGGVSVLAAANNQPRLDRRAEFAARVNALAPKLRGVKAALALTKGGAPPQDLPQEAAQALRAYQEYADPLCLLIAPLPRFDGIAGHLAFEFFDEATPGQVETLTLLNMTPFFASALVEKWMMERRPRVREAFARAVEPQGKQSARGKAARLALYALLICLVTLGLMLPVTLRIGGRIEVVPEYEYFAFVQMDGIVDKVTAREGDEVAEGVALAELETKEIDYKIRESARMLESLRAETEILRNQGAENPAKLAESQLTAIKSLRAGYELEFLNWQKQFLTVRAPRAGTILTKKIEGLTGKRFKAGEPFCRIAPKDPLEADILVRESDASYAAAGQFVEAYFNFQPDVMYTLKVKTVSPISETLERLGAVFRVRATFDSPPRDLKPGMLGIAHIHTTEESLWFVLTRRIRAKIGELLLTL